MQRSNAVWQLLKHAWLWTILLLGIGVKLPAKLIVVEEKRIIAAVASLIFASPKLGHKSVHLIQVGAQVEKLIKKIERLPWGRPIALES
jgi:hypothetical protein